MNKYTQFIASVKKDYAHDPCIAQEVEKLLRETELGPVAVLNFVLASRQRRQLPSMPFNSVPVLMTYDASKHQRP